MRPFHRLFGGAVSNQTVEVEAQPWNTLMTLQLGAVADVDSAGRTYLRNRPVSVEVWFGHGARWIRGTAADGLRQTRLDGLPIVETRQRVDDGDVVQTAWADEAGNNEGRVVLQLTNEASVSLAAAIVVRPQGLVDKGAISQARVVGSLIVVDGVPLVDIGRDPGATVTATDSPDAVGLLDQLSLDETSISGDCEIADTTSSASIAVVIPLARGATRQIEILDGHEAATVAPAPLDTMRTGWKTHLANSPSISLPGWPAHLPTALLSSLVGSAISVGRPLGDTGWVPADDSLRVAALARAGVEWAAAHIGDALLSDVTEGRIDRREWAGVASAVASLVSSPEGVEVLQRHPDAVAAVAGHCLSKARNQHMVRRLIAAISITHGVDAASDATGIAGKSASVDDAIIFCQHGFGLDPAHVDGVGDVLAERSAPKSALEIGLSMAACQLAPFEPIVPVRSSAGSTWRWQRNGCGDSPHARASLLLGLTSHCAIEMAGADGTTEIDLFGGASSRWLGQKLSFTAMPTLGGRLSVALRWHGERPALLWEFEGDPVEFAGSGDFALTCSRLDPGFRSTDRSGEALLAVPEALVAEGETGRKKAQESLL